MYYLEEEREVLPESPLWYDFRSSCPAMEVVHQSSHDKVQNDSCKEAVCVCVCMCVCVCVCVMCAYASMCALCIDVYAAAKDI